MLKLMKCPFVTETIDYSGHVIRSRRLEMFSHTTNAIFGLKKPAKLPAYKYYFGLRSVLRIFIPNFLKLVVPLNSNLKKEQPPLFGSLNDKGILSQNALKCALMSLVLV